MEPNLTIAFTGHRAHRLGGYHHDNPVRLKIKRRIAELLAELKPQAAICGMAMGVDSWAAEVCIEMHIPYTAAIPFYSQYAGWPEEALNDWLHLYVNAAHVVVVSQEYDLGVYWRRNEWMVDHAQKLIAVWDGVKKGGTWNTIRYAELMDVPVLRIDPSL